MMRLAGVLGIFGLGAAIAAIAWGGYRDVLGALEYAGWGILATSAYRLVPMLSCVIGWRALFPAKKRLSPGFFLRLLWIRSAIDGLLPVARIGGDIVVVRAMVKRGIRKELAITSTIVEITLSVIALLVFNAVGVGVFLWRTEDRAIGGQLVMGLLSSIVVLSLFLYVQQVGLLNLLSKISKVVFGRRAWLEFIGSGKRIDHSVRLFYRRKKRIAVCSFWELMSWFLGSGEIWLALYFLGHPVPLADAVVIEALIQASVNVAFMVPAALGVQDAGFLLFGHVMAIPPDIAAALAIIRRCGDLLVYVPGLVAWQLQEGYWFLRRKPLGPGG